MMSMKGISTVIVLVAGMFLVPFAQAAPGDLLVSSGDTSQLLRYDGQTGACDSIFASEVGPFAPQGLVYGPDGNVYVSAQTLDAVLRYNGDTGAPLPGPNGTPGTAEFVPPGSGGLNAPLGLDFGPDGNLYVSHPISGGRIRRFDGQTGQYIDDFVTSGSGGLSQPHGLAFGPDGNLYVSSLSSDKIMRYDGTTGAPLVGPNGTPGTAEFVPPGSGGLDGPVGLVFGADGHLYVCSYVTGPVMRYDGTTGAPLPGPNGTPGTAEFVPAGSGGLGDAHGLVFGPDAHLYVTSLDTANIMRYDGSTGSALPGPLGGPGTAEFVPAGSCGLSGPTYMVFVPDIAVPIPTTSEWGLIVMMLLLLTAGTIVCRQRYPAVCRSARRS